MSELSRRILQRRLELGLSQEELAQRMGYRSKSSITKLEKGVNDIPQSKVEEFAAALETTPAWLMGLENTAFVPPGFEPLPEMVRVPLVGSIACGSPITAEQNIECYIGVPAAWHAFIKGLAVDARIDLETAKLILDRYQQEEHRRPSNITPLKQDRR